MRPKHMKALREQRAKGNARLRAAGLSPCDHKMVQVTDLRWTSFLRESTPEARKFYRCSAWCDVWFVL